MSGQFEYPTDELGQWLKYVVGSNLYGRGGDTAVLKELEALGRIIAEVRDRKPDRFDKAVFAAKEPLDILRAALKPQFTEADLDEPKDARDILIAKADATAEAKEAEEENDDAPVDGEKSPPETGNGETPNDGEPGGGDKPGETPEGGGEPTPEDGTVMEPGPDDKWIISLYLRRVKCVQETRPLAGKDEMRFFGQYSYNDKTDILQEAQGLYDSGNERNYVPSAGPQGYLLASEEIPATTQARTFRATVVAFEDDGMTAESGKLLAQIIANLVTVGVNSLIPATPTPAVTVPAAAKQAYQNLGLPALLGVLAKLFGPDPFIPIDVYAKTKWPPNTPSTPPVWWVKIPSPGGRRRRENGEGMLDGSLQMAEATVEERTLPNGTKSAKLARLDSGGRYTLYVAFVVEAE